MSYYNNDMNMLDSKNNRNVNHSTCVIISDDGDNTSIWVEKEFKVNVVLTGVDSQTGELFIRVQPANWEEQTPTFDPFANGRAGTVDLDDFVFPLIVETILSQEEINSNLMGTKIG